MTEHTVDDALFAADPVERGIARELFAEVRTAPIISPHGHVDAAMLAEDRAFPDPTALLITPDHYVTRLLHADGVDLADLGVGAAVDPRAAWRLLAGRWHLFAGTASGFWFERTLRDRFGVEDELTAASADRVYDRIAAALAGERFRPQALFDEFGIAVLATTDDPLDDLAGHARLRESGDVRGRVAPTFRPDAYLDPAALGFASRVLRLLGGRPASFDAYLDALQERRGHFVAHGAFSADHGVIEPYTVAMEAADAERLFQRVLSGEADAADEREFRGHMLWQMARMSVEDGLVMTIHPGVHRDHSPAVRRRYGADAGADIPVPVEYVRNLKPLLDDFGLRRDFHLVLFTIDETVFSREIAPLAGFYPSVFIGSPWWFIDAPEAIARFRAATAESAGFYRSSGFVDDTRAFLSIPVRHEMARRADAAALARMVVDGRIRRSRAEQIIRDLVDAVPRRAFKL